MTGQAPVDDKKLKKAYADVYTSLDKDNARTLLGPKPADDSKAAWNNKYVQPASGSAPAAESTPNAEPDTVFKDDASTTAHYAPSDFPVPRIEDPPVADPVIALTKAQSDWKEASLNRNKSTIRGELKPSGDEALRWINSKIKQIQGEIDELKAKLPQGGVAGLVGGGLQVINANGVTITEDDRKASPGMNHTVELRSPAN